MTDKLSGKKKQLLYIIAVAVLSAITVLWLSPTAFAHDGILTREKVEDYQTQYDLGATRRHDYDITDIYLFYAGFEEVSVQKEESFEGHDVTLKRILPFIYKWERKPDDCIFRVTIGKDKYYYTFVST